MPKGRKILFLMLVVTICLVVTASVMANGTNLLTNPDLEIADPTPFPSGAPKPLGWKVIQSAYTKEYKWDDSVSRSGNYSAKLGPVQPGISTFWQTQPAIYNIEVGKTYRASVYVKTKGEEEGSAVNVKARVTLYWWRRGDTLIRSDIEEYIFTSDTDWTQITIEAVAPEGAYYVVVGGARGGSSTSAGNLWFDDFELIVVAEPEYTGVMCYPSSFSEGEEVQFGLILREPQTFKVSIYDERGKLIWISQEVYGDAGYNSIVWDGCDNGGDTVQPGIYQCVATPAKEYEL